MSFTPDTDLVDRVVPSPAGEIWSRGGAPILGIAIHMAQGGGTENHLDNLDGNSSHYVIKYSGELVQMVPESKAAGSMDPTAQRTDDDPTFTNYLGDPIKHGITALKRVLGKWYRDPNRVSIAIEIEGFAGDNTSSAADPDGGPNDKQERTLVALVKDIRSRRGAKPVFGHRDQQKYKWCPGKRIPWRLLGGHAAIPTSEGTVPGLTLSNFVYAPGFARVKAGLVGVQAVQTGDLDRFPFAAGQGKEVIGVATLVGDPLGKKATLGDTVRVIGGPGIQEAIFFDKQVDFEPAGDVTPYSKADLDAAIAADRARARVTWA